MKKLGVLLLAGGLTLISDQSKASSVKKDGTVEFHVSTSAAVAGNGTKEAPFKSIEEARDAARAIRDQAVVVNIHGGHYLFRNGLRFTKEDSQEPGKQVSYRAVPGEQVRISTGVLVPLKSLQPVTDEAVRARMHEEVRDKVRQLPLKDIGISAKKFPNRFQGIELLEVLWNGSRLPLSRWPDSGYSKIEKVLDNGIAAPSTGTFVYRGDAPSRWGQALPEGIWMRGFWRVPWTIESVKIGSIDPEAKTITLAVPIVKGIGSKYHRAPGDGVGQGSGEEPWEVVNLIEEISLPGEWAVRFNESMLYILPPEGDGELLISDSKNPAVEFLDVSNVSLEGVSVDCGLGDGIVVKGGENVMIAGCRAANFSRTGIAVLGGKNHLVLSCDTSETGLSGIKYLGGDRKTLSPGGHRILNNIVTRAGLFYPEPGIDGGLKTKTESVGNLVAHNRIHDCMNSGVVYSGNENVFEYNEIYRIGLGSSDLGCFYSTGGWTSRGNIIRYNMVHHSMNANAFYVDDGDCGDTFLSNIAYKTESGGFIGGGSDQIFRNNIIVSSPRAMHVDSRGVPRKYTPEDTRLRSDLDSVPYQSPPWSEKYPELVNILESKPEYPVRVVIEDNLFVDCKTPIRRSGKPSELEGIIYKNNMVSDDLGLFSNIENLDFTLKSDSPVFQEIPGFKQIPVSKIGIYPDAYRPLVPSRDMELLKTGNTDSGFDSQMDVNASNKKKGH
jgi:hypothetical protein